MAGRPHKQHTNDRKKRKSLTRKCYNSDVSSLNIIVQVRSNICSICQQASECPMQRTMLAAVQATAKRLIAPRYLMGQNNV